MDWDWKQIKVVSLSAALPPFQIYHPWIDHEAISVGQSFRVITVQVNENKTLVCREAGSVLDKCCSVHSYNPVSHVHGFNLQLYRQGLKMRIFLCVFFCECSNKFSAFTGFPFLKHLKSRIYTAPISWDWFAKTARETSCIAPFKRMRNTEEYQPSKVNLKLIISLILKPVHSVSPEVSILREDIYGKLQINGTNKKVEELTQCTETRNRSAQVYTEWRLGIVMTSVVVNSV